MQMVFEKPLGMKLSLPFLISRDGQGGRGMLVKHFTNISFPIS